MGKVQKIQNDVTIEGNLVVHGGLNTPSTARIKTKLASTEEAVTTINGTLVDVQGDINTINTTAYRFETRYKRSATTPDTPTGTDPAGWTVTVPSGADAIWFTGATFLINGTLTETWFAPVRFTGAATIVGVLSNERHSIPTDADGLNPNFVGAFTTMSIYEGGADTTSLWTFALGTPSGITGSLSGTYNNTYTVTGITADACYVDIIASRSGMSDITKTFKVYKAKQGDQVPAYRMSASTVAVKVNTDFTFSPSTVVFEAYSFIGLAEQVSYDGLFKVFINEVLQQESTTPQSSYTWDGFARYPANDLYPSTTLLPNFEFDFSSDLLTMTVQLWSADNSIVIDSQSVVFLKDVGFSVNDFKDSILEKVPERVPAYLGKFLNSIPSIYKWGDWFLVYGVSDTPYVRGVHFVQENLNLDAIITGAYSADSTYMVAAMSDILEIVNSGLYGTMSVYSDFAFFSNLAANIVFVNELFARDIKASHSIRVGDRYTANGGDDTVSADGAYLGANGVFKAKGAVIEGAITATSGSFTGAVNATSGSFTGAVNATSGSFTGAVNGANGSFGSAKKVDIGTSGRGADGISIYGARSSDTTPIAGDTRLRTEIYGVFMEEYNGSSWGLFESSSYNNPGSYIRLSGSSSRSVLFSGISTPRESNGYAYTSSSTWTDVRCGSANSFGPVLIFGPNDIIEVSFTINVTNPGTPLYVHGIMLKCYNSTPSYPYIYDTSGAWPVTLDGAAIRFLAANTSGRYKCQIRALNGFSGMATKVSLRVVSSGPDGLAITEA